ncbi:MAG TPA: hypothetical protein VIK87_00655 [Sphingomonadales bacterium]
MGSGKKKPKKKEPTVKPAEQGKAKMKVRVVPAAGGGWDVVVESA